MSTAVIHLEIIKVPERNATDVGIHNCNLDVRRNDFRLIVECPFCVCIII